MRKGIVIAIAVLGFVIAGYTAAWFWVASDFKATVVQALTDAQSDLDDSTHLEGDLSYDSVEATGYPFALTVHVHQPRLTLRDTTEDATIDIAMDHDFSLSMSLFGSDIIAYLPEHIDITAVVRGTEETAAFRLNQPTITLTAEAFSALDFAVTRHLPETFDGQPFRVAYQDSGTEIVYALANMSPSTFTIRQDATAFSFEQTPFDGRMVYDIAYKNDNTTSDLSPDITLDLNDSVYADFLWFYQYINHVNSEISLSFNIPHDLEHNLLGSTGNVVLRAFNFSNNRFGLHSKGELTKDSDDLFPYGMFTARITNLEDMVQFYAHVWNTIQDYGQAQAKLTGQPLPLMLTITHENATNITAFLRKISDDPMSDGPDVTITVSREKQGNDVSIGTLNFVEAGQLAQTMFASPPTTDDTASPDTKAVETE